jgi:tetratricopeptide (TPR) repeat protein
MRKAMDHLHAAHEHYSLADEQAGAARSLNSLGNVYRQAGDPASAMMFYDTAIAIARRCGEKTVEAQALANKAALLIEKEDLSQAEVVLDEARLLARESGTVAALLLNHRAVLAMATERYAAAADLLDQAEAAADSQTDAAIRFSRGRLKMKTGHHAEALALFEQALELDRRTGFSRGIADDLSAMADIYEQTGEDEAALDCLERSLKIHALLENQPAVVAHLDRVERLAKKTGGDIRVTIHFVNQWLSGEAVDAICR